MSQHPPGQQPTCQQPPQQPTIQELTTALLKLTEVVDKLAAASSSSPSSNDAVMKLVEQREEEYLKSIRPYYAKVKEYSFVYNEMAREFDQSPDPFASLRHTFEQRILTQGTTPAFSPSEILEISYLIYGTDKARYIRARSILSQGERDRMSLHNWTIFGGLPVELQTKIGPPLMNIDFPLFPCDSNFYAINDNLVSAWQSGNFGGAAKKPKLFKDEPLIKSLAPSKPLN